MADNTKIEWTDATANYVNGCSVVSPGCTNCYAMRLAGTRLRDHPSRAGLTQPSKAGPVWTGEVRRNERVLTEVLGWKKPRRIFWNAHGDLFHPAVPDEWIDAAFAVMALTPHHTHQVLTKRPERMFQYAMNALKRGADWLADLSEIRWPLPNVWLGTSVEDQARADERVPTLLDTPAAVRFLSCEPLLGPVDLGFWACDHARRDHIDVGCWRALDWVIVGGESGPGARPMHPDWARSLRDQCAAAAVPFHFKQWGEWAPLAAAGSGGFWPTSSDGCIRLSLDGNRAANGWPVQRVGKKHAGRLLDGVQHDGFPA